MKLTVYNITELCVSAVVAAVVVGVFLWVSYLLTLAVLTLVSPHAEVVPPDFFSFSVGAIISLLVSQAIRYKIAKYTDKP